MEAVDKTKELEKRIEELEYRISILESFIDSEGVLMGKHNQSNTDAMKIAVKNDLQAKGYQVENFKNRLGQDFYLK